MDIWVNDDNALVASGLSALLDDKDKPLNSAMSLWQVEKEIGRHGQALLITELVTKNDDLERVVDFIQFHTHVTPQLKIVVLTGITDPAVIGLVKELLPKITLLHKSDAIKKLRQWVEQAISKQRINPIVSSTRRDFNLTPREFRLMKWYGSGLSLTDIGRRIHLSPKTVSHYRRSIFSKLRCESEVDFINKLRTLGFSK